MGSKTEQAGTTSGTETDPELSRKGSPPGASGRAVGIQFGSDSVPFRVPLGAFSGVPFLILFGSPWDPKRIRFESRSASMLGSETGPLRDLDCNGSVPEPFRCGSRRGSLNDSGLVAGPDPKEVFVGSVPVQQSGSASKKWSQIGNNF